MATTKKSSAKKTTKAPAKSRRAAGASKAGAIARRPAVTLVTGGTGFLGSHLVRLLIDEGVKPLRVLSTSAPAWLEELGVESVEGSITSPEDVLRAVEGAAEDGGCSRQRQNQSLGSLKSPVDTDGIIFDKASNRLFAVSGDGKVAIPIKPDVDPRNGKIGSRSRGETKIQKLTSAIA